MKNRKADGSPIFLLTISIFDSILQAEISNIDSEEAGLWPGRNFKH